MTSSSSSHSLARPQSQHVRPWINWWVSRKKQSEEPNREKNRHRQKQRWASEKEASDPDSFPVSVRPQNTAFSASDTHKGLQQPLFTWADVSGFLFLVPKRVLRHSTTSRLLSGSPFLNTSLSDYWLTGCWAFWEKFFSFYITDFGT